MKISVIDDDSGAPAALIELARVAVATALSHELDQSNLQVSVLLATAEYMRELNTQFNDDDKVTDVLSFNQRTEWSNGKVVQAPTAEVFPAEIQDYLGDIAICFEQADKQANAAGVTTEYEFAKLAVHGALHLLGYDHHIAAEERQMFTKTDQILAIIFNTAHEH